MKTPFILAFLIASLSSFAQETVFDSTLAKTYGADNYGMKMYVLTILTTGETKMEAGAGRDSIFRGHLDNIGRLAEEGILVVAGPLAKNENRYRGIFIFNTPDIAVVDSLLMTDPAVAAGILGAENYNWYGAAALPAYLDVQEKITKESP